MKTPANLNRDEYRLPLDPDSPLSAMITVANANFPHQADRGIA